MYTVIYEDGSLISDEGCNYLIRSQWRQLRTLYLIGMNESYSQIT
jgi:hypothetical protein